jgi:peptide deformylase
VAVYQVVKIGDPVLRDRAREVPRVTPSIEKLLQNMADTMYDAEGVGLAAPQIGISKRVIVIDAGEGLLELINPEILEQEGQDRKIEGCLSVPGIQGEVIRAYRVKVKGWDRTGKETVIVGEGLLARALQHEIDHLNGVLFVDKIVEDN